MPAGRNFKVTVLLVRREKVQDDFHSDESGARLRIGARKPGSAMEMVALASRGEGKPLCAAHECSSSATIRAIRARHFAFETDTGGSVLQNGVGAGCQSGILLELQFLVILESFIRGKEQEAKSVPGPAVITKKPLQALFLGAHLIVNGCDSDVRAGGGFAEAAVIGLRA